MRAALGYWPAVAFAALAVVPLLPAPDARTATLISVTGGQLTPVFCYAILALGLNVVVGYAGQLHLGIAAFFGIGAYAAGILTVPLFPFQASFPVVLAVAVLAAAAAGVATAAPTLRLRGDYLALVTMGFGLIAVFAIRNLDAITDGTRGLNPVAPHLLPGVADANLTTGRPGWGTHWRAYPFFYWLCLGALALTSVLLRNLERSRLGRGWEALREDELAATCMGLNPARLKLWAIAVGAGLAGLGGALYAVSQRTTAGPQAYDFNRSIITLVCVILGGLGNRNGVILGVFVLLGYDTILTPELDNRLQQWRWFQESLPDWAKGKQYTKLTGWRLAVFGLALVLLMRFRPAGLLPSSRVAHDLPAARPEA